MSLTIHLPVREDQTSFNLRRWEEIMVDPLLSKWDGSFETDRYGKFVFMPPPGFRHGEIQAYIASLLRELFKTGSTATESPVSTSDGVKCPDVVWLTPEQRANVRGTGCLPFAPAICVEIKSPGNSWTELTEKKALYFEAGASEVWVCEEDGKMLFFRDPQGEAVEASGICPDFPKLIEV